LGPSVASSIGAVTAMLIDMGHGIAKDCCIGIGARCREREWEFFC
jgi:hypothetical protein